MLESVNILNEIAQKAKERVREKKRLRPLNELRTAVENLPRLPDFLFEKALRGDDIAFICEVKKASPSKGVIAEDFSYLQIAREYETAGATALSVLTEPFYFKGDDVFLQDIAAEVKLPVLRKDFTVDEYMIYEARLLGASAVLLICAILDESALREYIEIAHGLGLSALVEIHDESEAETAVSSGARIIGVNNRDLKTFNVDISLSERLRPLVPKNIIFVSESGIKTAGDVQRLRNIGADAVLVGETLMRSADKKAEICKLKGEFCRVDSQSPEDSKKLI